MGSVHVDNVQLLLAAGLMLVSLLLSWRLRLGLGRDILVASVRMTVQLLLVGLVLAWVFSLSDPFLVVGIGLVMSVLAAQAASQRPKRRYAGLFLDSLVSILFSSFALSGVLLGGILDVRPWFLPQYAVPVLGMVLGNALTGVSLAVDRFTAILDRDRGVIESLLALGATRREAAQAPLREAMRTGMIPTLNSMAVMGIVSLPGMMTGQILGGAPPEVAVRYQIVIMFVIAASTSLGCLISVQLAFRRLFDAQHRLRAERLAPAEQRVGGVSLLTRLRSTAGRRAQLPRRSGTR
jgi:putative ABC transport system permease protein